MNREIHSASLEGKKTCLALGKLHSVRATPEEIEGGVPKEYGRDEYNVLQLLLDAL